MCARIRRILLCLHAAPLDRHQSSPAAQGQGSIFSAIAMQRRRRRTRIANSIPIFLPPPILIPAPYSSSLSPPPPRFAPEEEARLKRQLPADSPTSEFAQRKPFPNPANSLGVGRIPFFWGRKETKALKRGLSLRVEERKRACVGTCSVDGFGVLAKGSAAAACFVSHTFNSTLLLLSPHGTFN